MSEQTIYTILGHVLDSLVLIFSFKANLIIMYAKNSIIIFLNLMYCNNLLTRKNLCEISLNNQRVNTLLKEDLDETSLHRTSGQDNKYINTRPFPIIKGRIADWQHA